MKTITAFELSDGTIVTNKEEAISKEKEINMQSKLDELCKTNEDFSSFSFGIRSYEDFKGQELAKTLFKYRKELLKILKD